jgi:hypothetical protein
VVGTGLDVVAHAHNVYRLAGLTGFAQDEPCTECDDRHYQQARDTVIAHFAGALAALGIGFGLGLALHTCFTPGGFLGGQSLALGGCGLGFSLWCLLPRTGAFLLLLLVSLPG